MGNKRIEIDIRIIDVDEELEKQRQEECEQNHLLYSDKDNICSICVKCLNEDF